jgi:DNA-binding GntR family transcriptional regulator
VYILSEFAEPAPSVSLISNQVHMSLKKAILQGKLQPGQRLLILEIANSYNTSQAPVREALERLKQDGLVEGKPNKGAIVRGITHKDIKDAYLLRQLVEEHAMREAYKRMITKDLEYLANLLICMKEASEQDDPIRLIELDMEFHGFFYHKCDNRIIADLWDQIKSIIMCFIIVTNQYFSGDNIVQSHERLLTALQSPDPLQLTNTLSENLQFYKNFI